jgi:predicted HTH domain antitoxin
LRESCYILRYADSLFVIDMVRAEVDLPGSILALIKVDKDQLGSFIKRSLAVELYREGKLSLGKAAELAGMHNKWEMLMLLSESGVPLDYSALDAEDDFQTLKEVLNK